MGELEKALGSRHGNDDFGNSNGGGFVSIATLPADLVEDGLQFVEISLQKRKELEAVAVFRPAFLCRQVGPDHLGDGMNRCQFPVLREKNFNAQKRSQLDGLNQVNKKPPFARVRGNAPVDLTVFNQRIIKGSFDTDAGMTSPLYKKNASAGGFRLGPDLGYHGFWIIHFRFSRSGDKGQWTGNKGCRISFSRSMCHLSRSLALLLKPAPLEMGDQLLLGKKQNTVPLSVNPNGTVRIFIRADHHIQNAPAIKMAKFLKRDTRFRLPPSS
jgi:hypothetical protein